MSWNAMSWNAMSWNALASERLGNELTYQPLSGSPMHTEADGRELLTYIARCALNEGDVLIATDTSKNAVLADSTLEKDSDGDSLEYKSVKTLQYRFAGLLGLAPEWEHGPLSPSKARLISACLVGHLNAYGQSVTISIRSHGALEPSADEKANFPVYEGTFFGMVFDDPDDQITVYGCQGDARDMALAQSPDRALRSCTDPSRDCQVVSVGRCRDVCEERSGTTGWRNCWADGVLYAETISTYLAPDNRDETHVCTTGDCSLSVSGIDSTSHLDCTGAQNCDIQASDQAVLNADCGSSGLCKYQISNSASGEIDCRFADTCEGACSNGSWCEVDCLGAGTCDKITCDNEAECLLNCKNSGSCQFEACNGVEQSCPGNVVVCNRACP